MISPTQLSIIIPCYNTEPYIVACLESIVQQGGRDSHIIVVDDGSSDRSVELVQAFQRRHPRLTLIEAEHGGLGAARNIGMDAADTEFVSFVDSDDLIAEQGIAKLCAAMHPDVDILFSNKVRYLEQTGRIMARRTVDTFEPRPISQLPWYTLTQPPIHGRVYSLPVLRAWNIRFPEGYVFEDVIFHHQLYARARKVAGISDITYLWRHRSADIGAPSIMQSKLRPYVIDSRLRQIPALLDIVATDGWRQRFETRYTAMSLLRSEVTGMHLLPLCQLVKAPGALLDYAESLESLHRVAIRFAPAIHSLPPHVRQHWEPILARDFAAFAAMPGEVRRPGLLKTSPILGRHRDHATDKVQPTFKRLRDLEGAARGALRPGACRT